MFLSKYSESRIFADYTDYANFKETSCQINTKCISAFGTNRAYKALPQETVLAFAYKCESGLFWHSWSRWFPIFTKLGSISNPMKFRRCRLHTTGQVPTPAKGSKTRSAGDELANTILSINLSGFWIVLSVFLLTNSLDL